MANNATGGSGGSIHGESVSSFADDYSLGYVLQSYMEQGSEKNLQPQIDQLAGTGGFLPTWTENQGIQAVAQTQPWPHVHPVGTGGFSPTWTENQGIPAAAQTQPWPHGQPAGTGGFLPIWTTNQGVHAAAQTQPCSQQQVTDTYGFSPELWTTKQGCQASAATTLLTEPATSGMKTPGSSAGNEEERRARKRENDRTYRERLKKERQDLKNNLAATGKLCPRVEALEAEVRLLKEHVFGNQRLQPHRSNEMGQDKISTSREFEEGPALTNSQTPSSSEPSAQMQAKVLPQAPSRRMIRFQENRKQRRERNAAQYNLNKTKK